MASLFPADLRGLPEDAVPHFAKKRVHPLLSFALPSEFVADPVPLGSVPKDADQVPSVGFPPLSRHEHRGYIHSVSFLPLTYVPSSAFLTLSTVCSPRSLSGLFHPEATCGVHPSRAFPAAKPTLLIEAPCPHDVSKSSSIASRSQRHQLGLPRLQVLVPDSNP